MYVAPPSRCIFARGSSHRAHRSDSLRRKTCATTLSTRGPNNRAPARWAKASHSSRPLTRSPHVSAPHLMVPRGGVCALAIVLRSCYGRTAVATRLVHRGSGCGCCAGVLGACWARPSACHGGGEVGGARGRVRSPRVRPFPARRLRASPSRRTWPFAQAARASSARRACCSPCRADVSVLPL